MGPCPSPTPLASPTGWEGVGTSSLPPEAREAEPQHGRPLLRCRIGIPKPLAGRSVPPEEPTSAYDFPQQKGWGVGHRHPHLWNACCLAPPVPPPTPAQGPHSCSRLLWTVLAVPRSCRRDVLNDFLSPWVSPSQLSGCCPCQAGLRWAPTAQGGHPRAPPTVPQFCRAAAPPPQAAAPPPAPWGPSSTSPLCFLPGLSPHELTTSDPRGLCGVTGSGKLR